MIQQRIMYYGVSNSVKGTTSNKTK